MPFRNWATKKLSKTVEMAIEPVKQNVIDIKDIAGNKAGLLANGLKVLVCVVIGWLMMKDENVNPGYSELPAARQNPSNIIINNYIREKETE